MINWTIKSILNYVLFYLMPSQYCTAISNITIYSLFQWSYNFEKMSSSASRYWFFFFQFRNLVLGILVNTLNHLHHKEAVKSQNNCQWTDTSLWFDHILGKNAMQVHPWDSMISPRFQYVFNIRPQQRSYYMYTKQNIYKINCSWSEKHSKSL